jgi:hypothetical protein
MNAILKRLRSPIIVLRDIVLSNQENYEIKKISKREETNIVHKWIKLKSP